MRPSLHYEPNMDYEPPQSQSIKPTWDTRLKRLYDAVGKECVAVTTATPVDELPRTALAHFMINACTFVAIGFAVWANTVVALLAVFLCHHVAHHAIGSMSGLAPLLNVLARAVKRTLFAWRGDDWDRERIAVEWRAMKKRLEETPSGNAIAPLASDWDLHYITAARMRYHNYSEVHWSGKNKGAYRFIKTNPFGEWSNALEVTLAMIGCAFQHMVVTIALSVCSALMMLAMMAMDRDAPYDASHQFKAPVVTGFLLGLMASAVISLLCDTAQATYKVVGLILDNTTEPWDDTVVTTAASKVEKPCEPSIATASTDENSMECSTTTGARVEKSLAYAIAMIEKVGGKQHIPLGPYITPEHGADARFRACVNTCGYDVALSHCVHGELCLQMHR